VSGTISVIGHDAWPYQKNGDTGCQARDGYEDIKGGTQVVVRNAKNEVAGLGALEPGIFTGLGPKDDPIRIPTCELPFKVSVSEVSSATYSVEVSHRGQLQYSRADLNQPLALSLGN
jgi:hypothetical protein